MLRWLLRKTVKPFTIRLRWYFQAEMMAELAALRAQIGLPDQAGVHSLNQVVHSVEAALLTLALLGEDNREPQE